MKIFADNVWNFNRAPGYATESMAPPGIVLCSECGREIKPDESCFDRLVESDADEDHASIWNLLYICTSCFKKGLG